MACAQGNESQPLHSMEENMIGHSDQQKERAEAARKDIASQLQTTPEQQGQCFKEALTHKVI